MCGESWVAVKDSLTHHPTSQAWASLCPLVTSFTGVMALCVLFVWVAFLSLLIYVR